MQLRTLLEIRHGLTAIIGGGGKTTLLYALAKECSMDARVIVCTTTPYSETLAPAVRFVRRRSGNSGSAGRSQLRLRGYKQCRGKIRRAPQLLSNGFCSWQTIFLVEADGSKHLPLKAYAGHEPVVPKEANQTILVLGVSGLGRPIREVAHRPALYAKKLGVPEDAIVTPELAARLLEREALHTRVLVNQVETEHELALARKLAGYLHCPVAAGALQKENVICLC